MKESRVNNVLAAMKDRGLSQILIFETLSIYYLTGIYVHPGERFYGLYLDGRGKHKIFLNKLFTIPKDIVGIEKVWYSDTDSIMEIVDKYIDHGSILGVDKELPAKFLLPLIDRKAAEGFRNASICIDSVRGCKDIEEQERMKAVSNINDLAMQKFKRLIVSGITEKEVMNQLLDIYRDLGADDFSFEPIVAFGANAAEGHHSPDDTVVREGDSILIDVGCKKDMYCSDMTRTFFYKNVSNEQRKVYDTVKAANEMTITKIKPGMKLKNVDKIARDIITKAGYGENFTHRLGHFIGLDVHEYGDVSSSNTEIVREGMIFSIEPGIYLENNLGVRIEDLVLVTKNGCKSLNHYPKALEIIE